VIICHTPEREAGWSSLRLPTIFYEDRKDGLAGTVEQKSTPGFEKGQFLSHQNASMGKGNGPQEERINRSLISALALAPDPETLEEVASRLEIWVNRDLHNIHEANSPLMRMDSCPQADG
jgi:hypothetical protein